MTETTFHFSPRPNRAAEIGWSEWGGDAFDRAQREDKPVLLGISAVWCHWCHVMDETSYSDPAVIQLINDRFVPVRVDNDQRPDINARYNMGGWPTTAFLTPDGEVMAGMTYVPPDQMRDVLQQVSTYYKDNKASIQEKIADIVANRERASANADGEAELSDQIFRDALHAAVDQYDPVYGGFGNEPKFPHTEAIDLLLHAYLRDADRDALHMARKTLEYMTGGGTYDQEWGGFYRYSTKRDWSVPHYEKMLEDNALLLRNLTKLYRITGDATHRRAIEFTIEYLDRWLGDAATGAFYGSQDADEEFYPLPAAERATREPPYVDRTVYTSWNAMAVSAYLEASWTLGRPELRERALRALDYLWAQLHREEQQKVRDELAKREAQSPSEFVKKQVMDGSQGYDFSTVNEFGKPLPKSFLTKDGRRFQRIEHFAHIVELFRMKEPDGAPMFRVEALPAAMRIIQEYIRSTKRQRDPESGIALLEEMEDKF